MTHKRVLSVAGIVVAVLLLLGGLGYFVADRVIAWGTARIMQEVTRGAIADDVQVTEATCGDTAVGGIATAVWKDVRILVDVGDSLSSTLPSQWQMRAEEVVLTWRGVFSGSLHCVLEDVRVQPMADARFRTATRKGRPVVLGDFQLNLDRVAVTKPIRALSPASFQMVLGGIARSIKKWMKGEDAATSLELRGALEFEIDGKNLAVGVQTTESDGGKKLVSNPADVRKAARVFGDPLTDAEVEIAARYPMRIPGLLMAKTTAEQMGRRAFGQSRKGDAYRHLAWSWLLSEQFGPDFAKAVTSAHEEDSDNPPAEEKRDRINNRLGRQYWEQGVPLQELERKIQSDSDVAL